MPINWAATLKKTILCEETQQVLVKRKFQRPYTHLQTSFFNWNILLLLKTSWNISCRLPYHFEPFRGVSSTYHRCRVVYSTRSPLTSNFLHSTYQLFAKSPRSIASITSNLEERTHKIKRTKIRNNAQKSIHH